MLNMIASTLAIGWEWSKIGRILGVSPWRWPKNEAVFLLFFPLKSVASCWPALRPRNHTGHNQIYKAKHLEGLNVPAIYPPVIQQFAMQVLAEKNMMAYLALRITQR
jgi:hypothetical protein